MSEAWGERWNEALEAGWRQLARSPLALSSDDDVQWVITPAIDNILSGVFATRVSDDEAEAAIERTLAMFASTSSVGGLWLLRPGDEPSDLPARLARRGLLLAGSGMGARRRDLRPPPQPEGVTFARATSAEDIDDWLAVARAVWGGGGDAADSMAQLFRTVVPADGDALQIWIGRAHGRPVAMSTAFVGAGAINVEYVGVTPDFRGLGVGSAVTWAPIAALDACELAVIGESDESASMYRRLGFKPFHEPARFALMSRNPPSIGG